MPDILATIATAVVLFVGTNLDDLILLTLFRPTARAGGRPRPWQIWAGQYVGVAILVVISLLAAVGLGFVTTRWIGVLGLIPLGIGVWRLVMAIRDHRSPEPVMAPVVRGLPGVVAVTIANGADNVAAYTPAFRTMTPMELAITLLVFAVAVAVWCLLGGLLTAHPRTVALVQRWGHWVIPVVFILIGIAIMVRTGLIG
ncbi:MAG: cadmium resistance transporter [Humibacter sp.]